MIKKIFILLLFFIVPSLAFANQDLQIYQAEKAYKKQNFNKALTIYQKELKQIGPNPALYYNIANIYFQQEQLGKAITLYEKALRITPRDSDILANLKLAKEQIFTPISPPPATFISAINKSINNLSINEWTILILFSFTIVNIFLILILLKPKKIIFQYFAIFFVGIFIFLLFPYIIKIKSEFYTHCGVAISKKVEIKSGPAKTLPTLHYIFEGTEFFINKNIGNWSEIHFSNGLSGWIQNKDYWQI